ncbi:hypothetical protein [Pseudonocardia sp. N23]|uniref:hypothetical protein n=1 Tax=Pseudonocardia sp. N23 TaxID=1987376 RepID=UPI001145B71C|nr:hypothetical protein [Pseudonocardia sp. N23]
MTVEMYRKAVPLTQEELDVLATVRTEGTALHGALIDVVGDAALRSEASTLHALVALGLAQLNERALAQGYAQLAAEVDDEDRAYRAAMRQRRRESADD